MEEARSLDHGPLEIKTKSIEKTLLPLVKQISTLVSHEERGSGALVPSPSCRAVARVGVAVNLAVERFVTVGESIAEGNPEVREEMYDACKEARAAGAAIERLCEGASEAARERGAVVRAARCLLSSVTRVLLLADVVVVKQLLLAKDRVRHQTETNSNLMYHPFAPPCLFPPTNL